MPENNDKNKKFYITTPIYYVNDKPHIGHTYTTLVADVYARFYRELLGKENVFFLTGTDEHGKKVADSAAKNNLSPQEFADKISQEYKDAWKQLDISYDEFFRTTDPRHKKIVQDFLQNLYDKGFIYKANYKGTYCVGCEKFLSFEEIVNGKCIYHPNLELVEQEEENYFFKLKEFTPQILAALEAGQYEVFPEERKNEILGKIKNGIEDISISRTGVTWGVSVPWDTKHTVYVWVDALINYYSATEMYDRKDFWPASLHLMAKDILWFHALIWEGLLLASGLPLPKAIFAHGFFTIDGQKMSKSLGNVINPLDLVKEYGVDATRYLLLTSFQFGKDGDISLARFKEKYNSDLANGIGNLVSRVAKLAEKLTQNPINPSTPFDSTLEAGPSTQLARITKTNDIDSLGVRRSEYLDIQEFFEAHKPDEALRFVWSKINALDQKLAVEKPWEIKDEAQLSSALKPHIEELINIGFALRPFMPDTSAKILDIFTKDKIVKGEGLFGRK
jgi:methionyl-tRNA synthetase